MADWILVPSLVQLRSEFNAIAPGRDKSSDGTIGDSAHSSLVSDHNPDETGRVPIHDADRLNEVHAIDVDKDLRTPGLTMEKVVQFLLGRLRAGTEKRLRYIIWNRRIWEASNGWRQRAYTGDNPHDQHAHFSASYETAREASKASWHLEDIPVALTAADKQWISAEINKALNSMFAASSQTDGTPTSKIGRDAWSQGIPNGVTGGTRDMAWEVLRDMGAALTAMQKELDELRSQTAAG
ncbi:MAG: hypothetical protein ABW022_23045 [Actinoplanes sp.]